MASTTLISISPRNPLVEFQSHNKSDTVDSCLSYFQAKTSNFFSKEPLAHKCTTRLIKGNSATLWIWDFSNQTQEKEP